LILDCKRSGLTRSSRRSERSLLPRVTDAVGDVMELSACPSVGAEAYTMMLGVLDFSDAFWLIPLHKDERRFFTTKLRGRFYAFLRTAQGSRGAPLTWSRFGALLTRLMQGILGGNHARLDLYVDDTFLVFMNTEANCRRDFALVVYLWTAIGLPLSLPKADFGRRITWTSGLFAITPSFSSYDRKMKVSLLIKVKPDTIADVTEITHKLRKTNVISIKDLRSYAGKCTAIASVIFTWSPFLRPLWAALAGDPS
jgi:hypothetical protein